MQRLTVTLGEQVPEIQSNPLALSIFRARDRASREGARLPLQEPSAREIPSFFYREIALESPFAHTIVRPNGRQSIASNSLRLRGHFNWTASHKMGVGRARAG